MTTQNSSDSKLADILNQMSKDRAEGLEESTSISSPDRVSREDFISGFQKTRQETDRISQEDFLANNIETAPPAVDEGFLSRKFSLSGPSAFEIVSPFTDKLGQNIGDAGRDRLGKIKESLQRGKEGGLLQGQTPFETAGQVVAETGSGLIDTGMEFLQAITPDIIGKTAQKLGSVLDLKQYLPESAQEAIGFAGDIKDELGIQTTFELVDTGIEKWQRYEQTNPREAADVKAGLFVLDAVLGMKGGGKAAKIGKEFAPEIQQAIQEAPQQFAKKIEEIQKTRVIADVPEKELAQVANDVLTKAREEAVLPTAAEQRVGITADVKKGIAGKGNELQRFTDQAQAGLLDDTIEPPLSLAVQDAEKAVDIMRKSLKETGGEIGQFRKKIASTKVPQGDVTSVIQSFDEKLSEAGLRVGKNRKIIPAKGRTTAASRADIAALQEFRNDLVTLKGDASLQRLIDVRNKVTNSAKFGKRASVTTDVVDVFAKDVRAGLRAVNAKAIGKGQAKFLDNYSEMLEFLDEWDRATSKGKSTETLLKRVFSERPRKARELFDFIEGQTGVNVMDSVRFAKIATEFLGNDNMRGLFQKEITAAGVAAANIVTGGKAGLIKKGIEVGGSLLDLAQGKVPAIEKAKDLAEKLIEATGNNRQLPGVPKRPIKSGSGIEPKTPTKPKAKEVSSSDSVVPKTSKKSSPLEVEAKKFKSAEEFVKAKSELRDKNFLERGKILGFKGEDEKLLNRIQEALDTLKRDGDRATFKNAQELVDVEDISKGILDTSERIDDLIARINRSTAKATNTEDIITKQQLLEIWNKANKTDSSPLEVEARKFKSAEEFVNSQPKAFHGTTRVFEDIDPGRTRKVRSEVFGTPEAVFLSENRKTAGKYSSAEANKLYDKTAVLRAVSTRNKDLGKLIEHLTNGGWESVPKGLKEKILKMEKSDGLSYSNMANDISEGIEGSFTNPKPEGVIGFGGIDQSVTRAAFIPQKLEKLGIPKDEVFKERVVDFSISPEAKINDIGFLKETYDAGLDEVSTNFIKNGEVVRNIKNLTPEEVLPILTKESKKSGFDGMRFTTEQSIDLEAEIAVWNKNVIKTKQQLTDIWNKANNK